MSSAAKKMTSAQVPLVESGIVRSTVFPNAMRDLRRKKGIESLRDFVKIEGLEDLNYTRIAKIERGQIFPRPEEFEAIAKALDVRPERLFINVNTAEFDREDWAREHIKASLNFRGGARQDMRLGAALRIRRKELGLATSAMKKYGLPAATVSRIENAERPFSRWDDEVRNGVRRVFGANSMRNVDLVIEEYDNDGRLGGMMYELFSPASFVERNGKAMVQLLQGINSRATKRMAKDLNLSLASHVRKVAESADIDIDRPVEPVVSLPKAAAKLTVYQANTSQGLSRLVATEETVPASNAKAESLAIRLDQPVLGAGFMPGWTLMLQAIKREDVKDNSILAILDGDLARVVTCRAMGRGFTVSQVDPAWRSSLTETSGTLMELVKVELG